MSTSPATRRLGAEDSPSRTRLLDAAEALLREEGHAAVSSRRVAARAGLKPQLVHYYFATMDDLLGEVFRRRADANLARFDEAITADGSVEALWALASDHRGTAFTMEFVALATHHPAIRDEVAAYAERFRAAQVAAMSAALEARGVGPEELPPEVAVVLLTGLSQLLALEDGLGVDAGHAETLRFVERMIAVLGRRRR